LQIILAYMNYDVNSSYNFKNKNITFSMTKYTHKTTVFYIFLITIFLLIFSVKQANFMNKNDILFIIMLFCRIVYSNYL
ncbi:MAG: hypothetical protein K0S55_1716, partial [Clostridia bacterium]|nr:hypothetical protein [Clostridia bacterium]